MRRCAAIFHNRVEATRPFPPYSKYAGSIPTLIVLRYTSEKVFSGVAVFA